MCRHTIGDGTEAVEVGGAGIVLCGVLGLVMGSFLTVVTSRLPAGLSIVTPGSHCPACDRPLRGLDNLPVVSFVLRRGRCGHCGAQIPLRYLVLELGTGSAFALAAARLGHPAVVPAFLVLVAGLIAASVIDAAHRRIPAAVVYATAALGVPLLVAGSLWDGRAGSLASALVAAAVAFAAFFALFIAVPQGIGFGDVRMAPLCAGFLGWFGWRIAAAGLLSGIVLAGLYGAGLVVTGRAGRKTAIPLGPFLAAGTYLGIVAGGAIASVWLHPHIG
jgi:leader peptidase (prepilin peptidase)/N-methyltransferase